MNVAVALKLTVARFINSSLVLVVANWDASTWFQAGSLAYDASILILSLAFTYPTTYLLNIAGWTKAYKRYKARKNKDITQREANILCEGTQIDPANNISNYMNAIITCIFYSPLLPHAIPVAMFGSIYSYWVYKYMFLRKHKQPDMFSEFMATFFANAMPYIGLLWAMAFAFFIEKIQVERLGQESTLLEPLAAKLEAHDYFQNDA